MKHIIGICFAFLSGAISTWLFINIESNPKIITPISGSDLPNNIDYSALALELSNEVGNLKAENAHLIETINSIKSKKNSDTPDQATKSTNSDLITQELINYKLNEISTNIKERISDDLQGYAKKISSEFDNEKKDIYWSEQQEMKLRTAINQDGELSGLAIRDIECKSSQCKVSVFSGSTEQHHEIFERLTKSISKLYQNTSYHTNPLENGDIKTIYFKPMQ